MSQISIINKVFRIQSFFSSSATTAAGQEAAIIAQGMNDLIAQKAVEPRANGRFIGLHPSSRTPVALRALSVGRSSGTPPIVLTPGQFIESTGMQGIEWGIPFGWMGGGFASLVVADGPEAFSGWPLVKSEVLIHRVRLPVVQDAAAAGLAYHAAWPTQFPFPSSSKPTIAVEPTKVSMRLRLDNLAAQADMRLVFQANDVFDIGSDGLTPGTTDFTYFDVTFPPAPAGILSLAFPLIEIQAPVVGGSITNVALVDISGLGAGGPLVGAFVDIARFGKI